MKARIPKDNIKTPAIVETDKPCKKKGFSKQPTMKELTDVIKPRIESDFQYMIEQSEDDNAIISTLNSMLGKQYISKFKPNTPLMKQCVKLCVYSFIRERIKSKVQRDIKNVLENGNHSEIEVLDRIQSPEYLEGLKPIASDELFKLIKETVDNFARKKKRRN